jgi:hypothetical protein
MLALAKCHSEVSRIRQRAALKFCRWSTRWIRSDGGRQFRDAEAAACRAVQCGEPGSISWAKHRNTGTLHSRTPRLRTTQKSTHSDKHTHTSIYPASCCAVYRVRSDKFRKSLVAVGLCRSGAQFDRRVELVVFAGSFEAFLGLSVFPAAAVEVIVSFCTSQQSRTLRRKLHVVFLVLCFRVLFCGTRLLLCACLLERGAFFGTEVAAS